MKKNKRAILKCIQEEEQLDAEWLEWYRYGFYGDNEYTNWFFQEVVETAQTMQSEKDQVLACIARLAMAKLCSLSCRVNLQLEQEYGDKSGT